MEEVYTFLKDNINDEYIVVGVSGGVDSMVLLSVLKEKLKSKIVCAHIHHNLRIESDEELEFVKKYCRNNDIIFEFIKLEYEGKFSEDIARTKRYNFFEEILKKYSSKILLTAHHGDDLIETIMMRVVRGSTIKGYSGIEKISDRGFYRILRPLLFCTKEEIYSYAQCHNIPYREDYTNELDDYTRNRYRKNILPFLKNENKKVHLKFLDYSDELLSYYSYVKKVIDSKYDELVTHNKVDLISFLRLDKLIQKEILKKYLFNNYGNNINKLTNRHIEISLEFLRNGVSNSKIDLPESYKLVKEYDYFTLTKEIIIDEYCYEIKDKVVLPNGHTVEVADECSNNSNYTTHLDLTGLKLPLYVRNNRTTDSMLIKNMNGHKKISDIFTNEKINLTDRTSWPVVTDATGKIIWLPGLKKTYFDRKNTEKYDIILKYY